MYTFLFVSLFLVSPILHGQFIIREKTINRVPFVYVNDIAKYFGFQMHESSSGLVLYNRKHRIHFPTHRRKVHIDSVITHLSFVPITEKRYYFVSQKDFSLLIDPILRIQALPSHTIRRIILDPGHGGKDRGAKGSRLQEKDINLIMARQVQNILTQAGKYHVNLTRNKDNFITLEQRSNIAKNWGADLFISIHCNSASSRSASGIETFLVTPKGGRSVAKNKIQKTVVQGNRFDRLNARFAFEMQNSLLATTNAKDRGVKYSRFMVLKKSPCPALLLELGFLSNKKEEQKLGSSDYQQKLAYGIAKGIHYFDNALQRR